MNYHYRNTYKKDSDIYVEDRGFLFTVSSGDKNFDAVDAMFGSLLKAGQSAVRSIDGDGWAVVDGDAVTPVYADPLARELRAKRNDLLAQTDYMMLSDYPLEPSRKVAIESYRQALRNLPEQDGWPFDVDWPALSDEV